MPAFTVKNLHTCQPRFVAFCKAKGLKENDTWNSWDYINWISDKATEFKTLNGLKQDDSLRKMKNGHKRFDIFLQGVAS